MTGPSQGHNATPRVPSVKSAIGILLNGFPVAVARSINCPSWYVDMADKASKKIAPMVEWYHHLIWDVFQAPCLPFILAGWSGFPSNDLMDGDIPQYIGFVGRITYENRPTVVLNTSHLLYVHSELTSYTKQHEVRHTVETSAAGLREERHRISYIVEVFRHPAAKEPRLTCPISPATHWRKVWSWMPSDPYNYIFHRFLIPYYIMLLIEDFFFG